MGAHGQLERAALLARQQHAAVADFHPAQDLVDLVEGGHGGSLAGQVQLHQPVLGLVRDVRGHALGHHRRAQFGHGTAYVIGAVAEPVRHHGQARRREFGQAADFIEGMGGGRVRRHSCRHASRQGRGLRRLAAFAIFGQQRQRLHGGPLAVEHRHALRAERLRHPLLIGADRHRHAAGRGEPPGLGGEIVEVVAFAANRKADEDQVGLPLGRHGVERLAIDLRLAEQRGGHVDGIARRDIAGQHGAQRGGAGFVELAQVQPVGLRRIRRQHAGGARVADRHHLAATRPLAAREDLRELGQFPEIVHAQDAVLAQEGIGQRVLAGHRPGVGAGGQLPGAGPAGLDGEDRHIARMGDPCGLRQHVRVAQGFDVQQHHAYGVVLGNRAQRFGGGHVGLVARGHHVAHADTLAAQPAIDDGRARAALADDGHGAVLRRFLVDHGREMQHGAGGEIGHALCVRPEQPQTAGTGPRHQPLLLRRAGLAQFGKARRIDHRALRPHGNALLDGLLGLGAGHADDDHLGRVWQRGQIGVGGQALNFCPFTLGPLGVDRVDAPAVAVALHIVNGPPAGLDRVV
ncbi:hypothetical protein D3C86_1179770 [compost metagenome]